MKLLTLSRIIASNEAAPDERADQVATNALDVPVDASADGWIKLCKYDTWSSGDSSRGRRVPQRFTRELAEKMVANFNRALVKMLRFGRGAPIYIGHPDVDPHNYPDKRRIGKIVRLEARNDGLWGMPEWNKLGQENMDEGYYVFPSVTWSGKLVDGVMHPDFFLSLGLTNTPAGDVEPTTHNAFPPDGEGDEPNPTDTMDPQLLAALGLEEGATLEDALERIALLREAETDTTHEEAMNALTAERDQLKTENETLRADRETAQNALATHRQEEAARLVGDAIESGRITEAERAGWMSRFEVAHEIASNALAEIRPSSPMNTQPIDIDKGSAIAYNSAEEAGQRFREEVARRQDPARNGADFNACWNSVKSDPKWAPVFQAWNAADTEQDEAAE